MKSSRSVEGNTKNKISRCKGSSARSWLSFKLFGLLMLAATSSMAMYQRKSVTRYAKGHAFQEGQECKLVNVGINPVYQVYWKQYINQTFKIKRRSICTLRDEGVTHYPTYQLERDGLYFPFADAGDAWFPEKYLVAANPSDGRSGLNNGTASVSPSFQNASTTVTSHSSYQPNNLPVWQECRDPSGKPYYYNRNTQKTQWANPNAVLKSPTVALNQASAMPNNITKSYSSPAQPNKPRVMIPNEWVRANSRSKYTNTMSMGNRTQWALRTGDKTKPIWQLWTDGKYYRPDSDFPTINSNQVPDRTWVECYQTGDTNDPSYRRIKNGKLSSKMRKTKPKYY